jgi:hypothetical protein
MVLSLQSHYKRENPHILLINLSYQTPLLPHLPYLDFDKIIDDPCIIVMDDNGKVLKTNISEHYPGECLFGGCHSTTTLKIINDTVIKTTNESFFKNTTDCQTKIPLSQSIRGQCKPDPETEKLYANLKAKCMEKMFEADKSKITLPDDYCAETYSACVFKDIQQEQVVNLKATCKIDDKLVDKIQQDIRTELNNKVSEKNDAFGQALNSAIAGIAGAGTQDNKEIRNSFLNQVTNSVNRDMVQKMYTMMSSAQSIDLSGSSIFAKGITQKAQLNIITDLMQSSETYRDAFEKISVKEAADVKTETRGLTDIIDSITDIPKTFFKALFGNLGAVSLICVVLIVLAGGYWLYKKYKSGELKGLIPTSKLGALGAVAETLATPTPEPASEIAPIETTTALPTEPAIEPTVPAT